MGSDAPSIANLHARLATLVLGRSVHHHLRLGSTNDEAARLARSGAPEGTLVIAREQTAGRGRHGRAWFSPAGGGLWASLVLRPRGSSGRVHPITLLAGLAAAEAVEAVAGLRAGLKWPNDLVAGGRKLGGLLCERIEDPRPAGALILGLGLNTNLARESFPEALRESATSTLAETGRRVANLDLLVAFLNRMDGHYALLGTAEGAALLDRYRARSSTLGRQVTLELPDGAVHGKALDVTPLGGLVLRLADGGQRTFLAGEVTSESEE
ncbi:MAG: biotin--[acetyl-CoA-carboxylase] ligase [Planctomycetes bacterium]|nr:biotin--[acetyl-CoA-carboxylase] ligase [Planctomycetota bacterium]